MRNLLAIFFRNLFKITFFEHKYYFFHQKLFNKYQLFKGLEKKFIYRDNIKLYLNLNDWIQQQIYFLGDYEKCEIDFLHQKLVENDVFLDIGANIGLFSLNASKILKKSGKVYSFEAYPPTFDLLNQNISRNNYNNIIAENLAISDKSGFLDIFYNDKENNIGMASSYLQNYNNKAKVKRLSLDEYVNMHSITKINLIKMDIEGGEYQALLGMEKVLKNLKPVLLMEVNNAAIKKANHTEKEVLSLLAKYGYSKIKELSRNESSYNAVFQASSSI